MENRHKDLKIYFSKEEIQMAKRHVKRCRTPLIIRGMQIKTTVRYYLTLVKTAIIKKATNNKDWRVCREKIILLLVGIQIGAAAGENRIKDP